MYLKMEETLKKFLSSQGVTVNKTDRDMIVIMSNGTLKSLASLIMQGSALCLDLEEGEAEEKRRSRTSSVIKKSPIRKSSREKYVEQTRVVSQDTNLVLFNSFAKFDSQKKIDHLELSSSEEIELKRMMIREIIEEKFHSFPDPEITPPLVAELISQYNDIFLDQILSKRLEEEGLGMYATTSKMLTRTAGTASRKDDNFIIKVSYKILMGVTSKNGSKLYANTQNPVGDRLNALMEIIEHELVHIINMLNIDSNEVNEDGTFDVADSHGRWFQKKSKEIFRHTSMRHFLIDDGTEGSNYERNDYSIDETVSFKLKKTEGIRLFTGKIIKLNPKNAKIQIDLGTGYSVPYRMIIKEEP
jgi:hypothetical protein